jgi:hypothetical protein
MDVDWLSFRGLWSESPELPVSTMYYLEIHQSHSLKLFLLSHVFWLSMELPILIRKEDLVTDSYVLRFPFFLAIVTIMR